jgi:hypothetical protein
MKTKLCSMALTALFFVVPSFSQDKSAFHVKSIHQETPDEHGTDKGSVFRYLKMVGTFDGKTYTVEAMDAGWTEALEVGKDYPATLKKHDLVIESTFKGRPEKIHWHILTVEE